MEDKIVNRRLFSAFLSVLAFSVTSMSQESLLIGPGDKLHVQVFDTPELDQHPRVTDAGTVPLLLVGDTKVAGMTPGEAAHEISYVLKANNYFLRPDVAVTVEEFGTQQISVLGEVKSPGSIHVTAPVSILTVISMAGGLTELADRHITIEHNGNKDHRLDYFISNRSEEALASLRTVYPGDTVLVPKVGVVYVIGDVARPGGYPMSTDSSSITALQAVATAGSTNKTSLAERATLVRSSHTGVQQIPLHLASIAKGDAADIPLQANDIIFVPFSWMKNLAVSSSSIAASTVSAAIYVAAH